MTRFLWCLDLDHLVFVGEGEENINDSTDERGSIYLPLKISFWVFMGSRQRSCARWFHASSSSTVRSFGGLLFVCRYSLSKSSTLASWLFSNASLKREIEESAKKKYQSGVPRRSDHRRGSDLSFVGVGTESKHWIAVGLFEIHTQVPFIIPLHCCYFQEDGALASQNALVNQWNLLVSAGSLLCHMQIALLSTRFTDGPARRTINIVF